MKDTKTELRFFSVPDWEKEQDYLREQHRQGWRFARLNALGLYHFERCEPEDVVYQLDYNPEGLEHKTEYVRMFNDCGWEYLQDYAGYSYFRKPAAEMNGDEEIFCDEQSRDDMIMRVFRGRIIPLICLFCLVLLPGMLWLNRLGSPLEYVYIALTVLYVYVLLKCAVSFHRFRNKRDKE